MPLMTPKVAKELAELISAFPESTPEQNMQVRDALTAIAHKQPLHAKAAALPATHKVILETIQGYVTSSSAANVLKAYVDELTPAPTPRGRAGR